MFITDVPAVFISDVAQLKIGTPLWHVGQGGISVVSKPSLYGYVYMLGHTVSYDKRREFEVNPGFLVYIDDKDNLSSTSYLDHHIIPQEYNNWYFCETEEAAQKIYDFMCAAWAANPDYEAARSEFEERSEGW